MQPAIAALQPAIGALQARGAGLQSASAALQLAVAALRAAVGCLSIVRWIAATGDWIAAIGDCRPVFAAHIASLFEKMTVFPASHDALAGIHGVRRFIAAFGGSAERAILSMEGEAPVEPPPFQKR